MKVCVMFISYKMSDPTGAAAFVASFQNVVKASRQFIEDVTEAVPTREDALQMMEQTNLICLAR
jgi:hypothetical protein